jgi:hypothetical protein
MVCDLANKRLDKRRFDIIAFTDVLEHANNPKTFIKRVRWLLNPNGHILFTVPCTSSTSYKLLGNRWFQYKPEHNFYFSKKSIELLLTNNGFAIKESSPNKKYANLFYIFAYLEKYSRFKKIANLLKDSPLASITLPVYFGERMVIAQRTD